MTSFSDLGVSPDFVAALEKMGRTSPFPVQALTIPDALAGRDVCGKAKTGSGKTLAFGLPVLERVKAAEPRRPRALILVPTRELAVQVKDELAPLGKARGTTVAAIYGGAKMETQVKELTGGVEIVVATPGAEPFVPGGYAAAVLLDTWLLLARSDLRASEEALRRWTNAAALVGSGSTPGRVLAVGDPAHPALQALVRWGHSGFVQREIEERRTAHLPPASRVATLSGSPDELERALAGLTLPAGAEVLGPVADRNADEESVRYVVRVPRAAGADLSAALVRLQAHRSARKEPHLRVEVDPVSLG